MAGAGDPVDALLVPLSGSVDDHIAACRGGPHATRDHRVGAICVDEITRSAGRAAGTVRTPAGSTMIRTIVHPGDLTGLWIELNAALSEWHEPNRGLAVCLHGFERLLEHVPLEDAFRFLHGAITRLRSAEAVTHVHLDPDPLADGDGWRLRRRSGDP